MLHTFDEEPVVANNVAVVTIINILNNENSKYFFSTVKTMAILYRVLHTTRATACLFSQKWTHRISSGLKFAS